MKYKIKELTNRCKQSLETSDQLKFAQQIIIESQQSQFYYSEQEVRKLLKALSPFSKSELTKVCAEFATNFEYFSSEIVRDFLISVMTRILAAGQKVDSHLDNVECLFMSGGSQFSAAEARECTAKDFCIEFVDSKTRKQFSILFPVEENYYFRTVGDIEKVLKGTYKLFNLGLTYSESETVQFKRDSYHPCVCATNDVEEFAEVLKTFLTTSKLDMEDIYSDTLFRVIEHDVSADSPNSQFSWYQPANPWSFECYNKLEWSGYSDDDKTTELVDKSSIYSLLHHISESYVDVKYKRVKIKDKR